MGGIWMRVRAELRSSWRAWTALALIAGIFGGASIAAFAGARRTESAYPRFLRAQDAWHASLGGGPEGGFEERWRAVRSMPEIADIVETVIVGPGVVLPATRRRAGERVSFPDALVGVDPSGRHLYEMNRARVLRGRLADRSKVDEALVPFSFADRFDVRVGDRLGVLVGFEQPQEVPVRVVGVTAAPGDFEAVGQHPFVSLAVTPAFYERHRERIGPLLPDLLGASVLLRDGPGSAVAFKQKVESTYEFDVPFIEPVVTTGVQKTMRLYAAALWIVGGLLAVATAAVFAQSISRQIAVEAAEHPALRALGMGPRALASIGLIRAGLIGIVAAGLAAGVAWAASPLMPIGTARIAEPDQGLMFDTATIGLGALVVLVGVVLAAVPASLRAARLAADPSSDRRPERTSRVAGMVARVTDSPSALAGFRMALERGRGRTAVPVVSTIVAVVVGVIAVTMTIVVGSSLDTLIRTPGLAGFTYDAIVPGDGPVDDANARAQALLATPPVGAVSPGTGLNVVIGGVDAFVVAFGERSDIGFAVIEGRAPTGATHLTPDGVRVPEIALGPATMRRMRKTIGDVVEFLYQGEEGEGRQRALVVGRAAIPALPWAAVEPGEGAMMALEGVRTFTAEEGGCCFVRFAPGTDLRSARAKLEAAGFETFIRTDRADLATLERITALPALLAAIFAAMATAALAHVLITGVRRRRRDLAILKTLGFLTRQVRGAIAWQVSTIVVVCVLIGLPAGIALGRWGWRAVAAEFGVVPVSAVPSVLLGVAAVVALALANAIAIVPARAAARTQPAAVLRSE